MGLQASHVRGRLQGAVGPFTESACVYFCRYTALGIAAGFVYALQLRRVVLHEARYEAGQVAANAERSPSELPAQQHAKDAAPKADLANRLEEVGCTWSLQAFFSGHCRHFKEQAQLHILCHLHYGRGPATCRLRASCGSCASRRLRRPGNWRGRARAWLLSARKGRCESVVLLAVASGMVDRVSRMKPASPPTRARDPADN